MVFGKLLDFGPKYLQPREICDFVKSISSTGIYLLEKSKTIKLPRFGAILNKVFSFIECLTAKIAKTGFKPIFLLGKPKKPKNGFPRGPV